MRYFVVSDDGTKYGPADVETLQGWISEGRLLPSTLLEEEGSGARIAASAVQGLNFPAPPMSGQPGAPSAPNANPYAAPAAPAAGSNPYATPSGGPTTGPFAQPRPGMPAPGPYETPPANYPRYPGGAMGYDDGSKDITTSWVLGAIGLFCLGIILAPIGIVYANKAKQKGNPGATAPLVFNIVVTVIYAAILVFNFAVIGSILSHGGVPPPPRGFPTTTRTL